MLDLDEAHLTLHAKAGPALVNRRWNPDFALFVLTRDNFFLFHFASNVNPLDVVIVQNQFCHALLQYPKHVP